MTGWGLSLCYDDALPFIWLPCSLFLRSAVGRCCSKSSSSAAPVSSLEDMGCMTGSESCAVLGRWVRDAGRCWVASEKAGGFRANVIRSSWTPGSRVRCEGCPPYTTSERSGDPCEGVRADGAGESRRGHAGTHRDRDNFTTSLLRRILLGDRC